MVVGGSKEGGSGGGTGTEAGIAMGGVGWWNIRASTLLNNVRPHDPRGLLAAGCWLLVGALLLPTQTNPLNETADTAATMPLSH